jgi:hypothetical protein
MGQNTSHGRRIAVPGQRTDLDQVASELASCEAKLCRRSYIHWPLMPADRQMVAQQTNSHHVSAPLPEWPSIWPNAFVAALIALPNALKSVAVSAVFSATSIGA